MVLYVVRHGETDLNVQGKYSGSIDIKLNEQGIKQAKQLKEKLTQFSFDLMIASSLIRARQTAEIINEALQIPLTLSDEFRERNMGVYEGLTQEDIKIKFPELWKRNCARQVDDAPINGETLRTFDERIIKALHKLEKDYFDKNVLLVTHRGVSMIINRYYNNLSFDEMHNGYRLGNCEIAVYPTIHHI